MTIIVAGFSAPSAAAASAVTMAPVAATTGAAGAAVGAGAVVAVVVAVLLTFISLNWENMLRGGNDNPWRQDKRASYKDRPNRYKQNVDYSPAIFQQGESLHFSAKSNTTDWKEHWQIKSNQLDPRPPPLKHYLRKPSPPHSSAE